MGSYAEVGGGDNLGHHKELIERRTMKSTNAALLLSILMDATAMPSTATAFLIDARPSNVVTSASSNDTRYKTRALTSNNRKILSLSGGGGHILGANVVRMNASATAAAATTIPDDSISREQTIAAAAFNLIKGCVGAGVLSLPAGVAAIGDVPKA